MSRATPITTLLSAIALMIGAHALSASETAGKSAPSPYPARAEDWPGKGVVRVFGWMKQNRDFFWTERAKKQGAIVFAGDSLTGTWKTLGADFPGTLVANRGIGGDVSRGLLFRFREDVLDLNPKAIVVLIGINDLTARQLASATLENIRSMLALRDEQHAQVPVFLCTVPPSAQPNAPVDEQQRRTLNDGVRQIAKETKGVTLVDLYAATATEDGTPDPRYFNNDLLHLSAAGHARWKEVLQPALQKAGVL
ncbi:MAG TPA: GDSL-type esterase/lipase family protein [Steroidobacter sp.]|uniref:GDSL-type esterase/lipase family protein n=1 Tax=Steroidobacter sp. TaxID=1978227 RepID=UPI002ED96DC1